MQINHCRTSDGKDWDNIRAENCNVFSLRGSGRPTGVVALNPADMLWCRSPAAPAGVSEGEGLSMIRELVAAATMTAGAISVAPHAVAYDGDVPGMNFQASLGAPCDNYERFIFGRGPSGQAEACHFPPPNQFPAATTGYWVISYPLYGVQQNGAKCPGSQAAAQTPDGLPMLCLGAQGWQPGWFTGAGFFPPASD